MSNTSYRSNPKSARPPSPEECERIAARFKALGEPTRLRILQAVCRQPRSVNEIVRAAGSTQANVSKHLALLAHAGILARRRAGAHVYYAVKDQLAVKLCQLVRDHLAE